MFSKLFSCGKIYGIDEPTSYETRVIPQNVRNARLLLGYDQFQPLSSKSAEKYPWDNSPEIKYNFN